MAAPTSCRAAPHLLRVLENAAFAGACWASSSAKTDRTGFHARTAGVPRLLMIQKKPRGDRALPERFGLGEFAWSRPKAAAHRPKSRGATAKPGTAGGRPGRVRLLGIPTAEARRSVHQHVRRCFLARLSCGRRGNVRAGRRSVMTARRVDRALFQRRASGDRGDGDVSRPKSPWLAGTPRRATRRLGCRVPRLVPAAVERRSASTAGWLRAFPAVQSAISNSAISNQGAFSKVPARGGLQRKLNGERGLVNNSAPGACAPEYTGRRDSPAGTVLKVAGRNGRIDRLLQGALVSPFPAYAEARCAARFEKMMISPDSPARFPYAGRGPPSRSRFSGE